MMILVKIIPFNGTILLTSVKLFVYKLVMWGDKCRHSTILALKIVTKNWSNFKWNIERPGNLPYLRLKIDAVQKYC